MSIKTVIAGKEIVENPLREISQRLSVISTTRSMTEEKLGSLAMSTESFNEEDRSLLSNVYNNIETTIKDIIKDMGLAVESFQMEAASDAAIFATNPAEFITRKLQSKQTGVSLMPGVGDSYLERPVLSTEAYDERSNRNMQLNSIMYNLLSSRQDDFCELFFPTIVVNSNDFGVTIPVKLFYAYNDLKRSVNGAAADFNRKNLVRAYADPTILKNELTLAIPVLRTGGGDDDNTDKFVPVAEVPSWSEDIGMGFTIPTGALKVETRVDLLGLSQTNELLNSGIMGPSDTLDTFLKLQTIYVKVTDGTNTDVIALSVSQLPDATYTYSPQGNSRRMIVNMDTDSLVLDDTVVDMTGAAPASMPELAAHDARISLAVSGSVILDKGESILNRGSLSLVALRNAAGQLVTGAAFASLAAKLVDAEVIGYTVKAYRANSNIRQRGQLLDTQTEFNVIAVPWRSPLSVIAPAINPNASDMTAIQTLITTTGMRVSNEGVSALLKAQQELKGYKRVQDANGNLPVINMLGHYFVKPTYIEDTLDISKTVNTTKSHERAKDIRAALTEKIRYMANQLYIKSEYKAASMVLTGNIGMKPTVIVGTDIATFNYIMVDGDLRTLGENFDVVYAATLDQRMTGKIFISFGVFDSGRNTQYNPINFGNMFWSPELTVTMPVSRDGQVSNEMIVTPRYVHNVNLPVLGVFTVENMPKVAEKIAMDTHAV